MEPPQYTRDRQNSRSLCFQHSKKLHRKGWLVLLEIGLTAPDRMTALKFQHTSSGSHLSQSSHNQQHFKNTQHMEHKNILQTVIGHRTPPQQQHCSICQSSALLNTLLRKHFISSTLLLNKHHVHCHTSYHRFLLQSSVQLYHGFLPPFTNRTHCSFTHSHNHSISNFECTSCNRLISL